MVGGRARRGLQHGLPVERLRQGVRRREGERRLDRRVRQGGAGGQPPGDGERLGREVRGRHHPVRDAERGRLLRGHGPREEQQVGGTRVADEPGQGPGDPRVGRQGHPGEGRVEGRGVRDDPEVRSEGEPGPGARGDPVDPGDDGLRHRRDGQRDRVVVLGDRGHAAARLQDRDVLLEVLADAEGPPAAGQQHRPDRLVAGRRLQRVPQCRLGAGVERVHRVRAVEGDGGEPVGHLVQHAVGHGSNPFVAATVLARMPDRRTGGHVTYVKCFRAPPCAPHAPGAELAGFAGVDCGTECHRCWSSGRWMRDNGREPMCSSPSWFQEGERAWRP
ncbi:hypothetical protein SCOCK_390029 [Actinacidiphila cocklensis]|uniref:Uncharacterized protein n=1 Tax=Actinacidiphila cocklensis TaxID=887465 RepID=A0A9W4DV25_9ACTN|nr:hypothetical protein SCOCK_390029 [Actinacidiphila cocklensis]